MAKLENWTDNDFNITSKGRKSDAIGRIVMKSKVLDLTVDMRDGAKIVDELTTELTRILRKYSKEHGVRHERG